MIESNPHAAKARAPKRPSEKSHVTVLPVVSDSTRQLAANLLAAHNAWSAGIGMDYARKTYVNPDQIGGLWLELAEWLSREIPEGICEAAVVSH